MKLTIRSSEWWRGNKEYSRMVVFNRRDEVEGYCCLGLLAKQLGAGPHDLCDRYYLKRGTHDPCSYPYVAKNHGNLPSDYPRELVDETMPLRASLYHKIANINDDPDLTDEERIEQLRPLFKKAGIEIEYRPDE